MMKRRALLLLATAIGASSFAFLIGAQLQRFATSGLTIVSATGPHRFTVEVAETPAQMEQGLMFRRAMDPDAGMLFDYKTPTMATMWMRNTLIPLDMLFVDAQGRIVNIHQRAVPQSLDVIAAAAPVRAVIELNGGTAARLGIAPGDQVQYPIFGNTPCWPQVSVLHANLRLSPIGRRRFRGSPLKCRERRRGGRDAPNARHRRMRPHGHLGSGAGDRRSPAPRPSSPCRRRAGWDRRCAPRAAQSRPAAYRRPNWRACNCRISSCKCHLHSG